VLDEDKLAVRIVDALRLRAGAVYISGRKPIAILEGLDASLGIIGKNGFDDCLAAGLREPV
jgi:hypothetical protein